MLTINALAAADEVIITVNPQLLAMMGLENFLRTVAKVKKRINPKLEVAGILLTMCYYDSVESVRQSRALSERNRPGLFS